MVALNAQQNIMPTKYIYIVFGKKQDLFKMFMVSGNLGGLWSIIWQQCCENNSNDLVMYEIQLYFH